MIDLHRNLLSGKPGRSTVGAFGVVLFVLSATGILMWLLGARNWRAWISTPKATSTGRFNYELHRLCGLWAYGFLALISFTGAGLAWPDTFKSAVQALGGQSSSVRAPKVKAELQRPLAEYLRAGRDAMPDGVTTEIRLPESSLDRPSQDRPSQDRSSKDQPAKGPVELRLHRAGDLAPSGNRVYLNPSTAAVLAVDRVADRPLGARFLASLAPLHYGEFGGLPVKAVWSLFAVSPAALFITGVITWWRRRKRIPPARTSRETASPTFALAGK
jgi:uncharacterized iron-regulated membrane protein